MVLHAHCSLVLDKLYMAHVFAVEACNQGVEFLLHNIADSELAVSFMACSAACAQTHYKRLDCNVPHTMPAGLQQLKAFLNNEPTTSESL